MSAPFTYSALKRHLAEAAAETLAFEDAGAFFLASTRARDCLWLSRQITALRLRDAAVPVFTLEAQS